MSKDRQQHPSLPNTPTTPTDPKPVLSTTEIRQAWMSSPSYVSLETLIDRYADAPPEVEVCGMSHPRPRA